MQKKILKFLSILTISVLLFSTTSSAAAVNGLVSAEAAELAEEEAEEESAAEAIAPGVWSSEEPYFTDEAPAISADISGMAAFSARAVYPTYAEAYAIMTGLQSEYPEGLRWTNFEPYGSLATDASREDGYVFQGGAIKGARLGVGCAAFCFILSDAVFGSIPARVIDQGDFSYEDLHVSDFLRMGGHFVTILKVTPSGVIVAEANYNKSVHWGRSISKDEVMSGTSFVVTRYPAGYSEVDDETETARGTEGTLTWSLSGNGVLRISGKGAIGNYDFQNRPSWEQYKDQVYSVIIEEGITSIGDYAFNAMAEMLEISIPGSVTAIGNSAFRESGLISAILPGSVRTIGDDAFRLCESLASVTIPEGVETVGERAFHSCTALKYVEFPSTLTKLGGGAFTSCQSLNQVVFTPSQVPGSLTIEAGAFMQCWNLNFISLPEGLTALPPSIFTSCPIISYLYIPATMASLAEAGEESPFNSSSVGVIYFGGTEAEWNALVAKIPPASYSTRQVIESAAVYFDRTDPFAPEPAEDPGDIQFPCANGHVGERDENGNCTVCGARMDDAVTPPAAHEHNWSNTWSSDDAGHWHECISGNCNIIDNAEKGLYTAHDYGDWSIDSAATATQSGTRHRDCLTCGYRQTDTIPPTGTQGPAASPQPPAGTEGPAASPQPPTGTEGPAVSPQPPAGTEGPAASPQPPTGTEGPAASPQPPTGTEGPVASPQPPAGTEGPAASPQPPAGTEAPAASAPSSAVTGTPAAPIPSPAVTQAPATPPPSAAGTESSAAPPSSSAETASPAAPTPPPAETEAPANTSEDDSEFVIGSENADSEASDQKSNSKTLQIIIIAVLLICAAGFGITVYFVRRPSRNDGSGSGFDK